MTCMLYQLGPLEQYQYRFLQSSSYLSLDKAPSNFPANKAKQVLGKYFFVLFQKQNIFWAGLVQASMFDFPVVYGLSQKNFTCIEHLKTVLKPNNTDLFNGKYYVAFDAEQNFT